MYEVFYNLKAEPFRLSPDHKFCYEHTGYAKARAYMAYAFVRAEGFVMITGRPGTGKTTLVGELVENLASDKVSAANLVCTQLGADDLLKSVAYSFGIHAENVDKAELLQRLSTLFHRWHRDGRRALLVVDEAQDLSLPAMEELRLLTNIQKDGQPLLQIFLLGQPELRDLILSPEMEQVHQRIVAASHLEGLAADEVESYVMHRLDKVGWAGDPAIEKAIFPLIHKFSEGIPRRINLICSRLFLHGGVEQRHEINTQDLRVVIGELQSENLAAGTSISADDFEAPAKQQWAQVRGSAVAETHQPEVRLRAVNDSTQAPQGAAAAVPTPSASAAVTPVTAKKKGVEDRASSATHGATDHDWPSASVPAVAEEPVSEHSGATASTFAERNADMARARTYPVRSVDAASAEAVVPADKSSATRASRSRPRTPAEKTVAAKAVNPVRSRALLVMVILTLFAVAAGIFLLPYFESGGEELSLSRWGGAQPPSGVFSAAEPDVSEAVSSASDSLASVQDAQRAIPATVGEAQEVLTEADSAFLTPAAAGESRTRQSDAAALSQPAVSVGNDSSQNMSAQASNIFQEDRGAPAPTTGAENREQASAKITGVVVNESAPNSVSPEPATSLPASADAIATVQPRPVTKLEEPLMLLVGFAFDSVRLEEGALGVLGEAARVLERQWSSRAQITGFADQSGDAVYNLDLSWDRARAVEEYLVAAGVERERLDVEGRGVVSELTPSEGGGAVPATDAERNRIVQIKIYPGS